MDDTTLNEKCNVCGERQGLEERQITEGPWPMLMLSQQDVEKLLEVTNDSGGNWQKLGGKTRKMAGFHGG